MKAIVLTSMFTAVFVSRITMLAAPGQDRTDRPGEPTQARVWIENRGPAEAIPVSLQPNSNVPPLRIEVTGTPTVTITGIVQSRVIRHPWEYRTITIPNNQDLSSALNAAGSEDWEATGIAITTQNGTIVAMKRPR